MERQSVEDSFKRAFHEAEIPPSSEVWTHIELGLEKDAGSALRRSVFYYRWMAAASVVLAISLLGVGYYTIMKDTAPQNPLALNTESPVELKTPDELTNEIATPQSDSDSEQKNIQANRFSDEKVAGVETVQQETAVSRTPVSPSKIQSLSDQHVQSKNNGFPVGQDRSTAAMIGDATVLKENTPPDGLETRTAPLLTIRNEAQLPPLVPRRDYHIHFPKTEPNQIDLLLAAIEMEEKGMKKEREQNKETLWTSVAMAAGAYNPVNTSSVSNSPAFVQSGNGQLVTVQASGLSNQVGASGSSFSSGVSVGGKIAKRWTLQGGVNYLTQNSSFSSNAVLIDASNNYSLASLNTLKSENFDGAFQASNPYMVTNRLQYFNIPLQAGYLLINKAFGWQIQGGISTDFFLQNTLSAEDAGLNKISQSSGDDSPYRTLNFSGLLGTEVSYRIGDHYRIAINPGLRYPLQSVYKSELGVSSTPVTFDVGLKFHYIFR